MKEKGTVLLLILSILLLAAGCGSQKQEKIVYLMHSDHAVFGSIIRREFDKIAREHKQPVEYLEAQNDADRQIAQMEEAIRQGVKIIVLQAVDEEKLAPVAEKAVDAGAAVIALNRHVRTSKVIGVYPDEYVAGQLQGDYMERNLPMGARIVYLQGTTAQLSSQERWEGFKKHCIDKRRDVRLLDRRDGDYSREEGKRIMKEWLEKYPQLDAVICGNDEMALGALAALKAAGRSRGCMVSGIDATEEALSAVTAGEMVQTVKQDAAHEAASAYQIIEAIQRGTHHPAEIASPFVSITRDSLADFRRHH